LTVKIIKGDCREVLRTLPDESVHCVVTSPPYFGLRDYGVDGQIGLEPSPDEFVAALVSVFAELRRVLRKDGTAWLNLGDSYAGSGKYSANSPSNVNGSKQSTNMASAGLAMPVPDGLKAKDLIGIPWRVAFALQADGWWLRQDIIWSKPNPMPESVTDRCTKAHEYLFLLSKSQRYHYDADSIRQQPSGRTDPIRSFGNVPDRNDEGHSFALDALKGANRRSVWEVSTQPFSEAHFATFPPALIEPCILAGCPKGGTVLDPFGGAGTTGLVADRLGRDAILIELNPEYAAMAERRIQNDAGMFASVAAE
jgi:DNA modification methylase